MTNKLMREKETYKYSVFDFNTTKPTKIPHKVIRLKDLDKLIGKKIIDAFHCNLDGDYYGTILLLEDGTELDIKPDGEYGDCMLMINGNEPK